ADALPPGATHVHQVAAPEGGMLMLHETRIILADGDGERTVRISVGVNRAEADILAEGFFFDMLPGLALLFAALVAGAWVQVGAGLRPVARVGKEVQAVREGRLQRLGAAVPTEILPLVEETNSLLTEREDAVRRARDRATDLAHGLKTPLTALNADIARLRDKGETGLADNIEALALRMRRTVERELARARMRHHGGVGEGASPAEAADAIARILQRTPAADGKSVTVSGGRDVRVALDPDDLNEVLGNLIENAVRHAASRVAVAVNRVEGGVRVSIDDDGAGAGHGTLERLTQRGVRDDERGGSAGLGLAIVSDILALYDRAPHFDASPLGGLQVSVVLPIHAGGRA
nr:HAMP domain-containing sensor histidine kinase [Rhizobiaceae bacterium]